MSLLIKKILQKIKEFENKIKDLNYQGEITSAIDFNSITKTGTYNFGGTNNLNRPPNWGIVEVKKSNGNILQRCTGSTSIATRVSWNNGLEWTEWKTYN